MEAQNNKAESGENLDEIRTSPKSKSLKKGFIIAICGAVVFLIMVSMMISLSPKEKKKKLQKPLKQKIVKDDYSNNQPKGFDAQASSYGDVKFKSNIKKQMLNNNMGISNNNIQIKNLHKRFNGIHKIAQNRTSGKNKSHQLTEAEKLARKARFGSPRVRLVSRIENINGQHNKEFENKKYQKHSQSTANPADIIAQASRDKSRYIPSDAINDNREFEKTGSKPLIAEKIVSPPQNIEDTILAGTIIPASLITGINSDLPGTIIAQVRTNIYNSTTGQYLLIPQGSRLIGDYNSMIRWGQDRVMMIWNRLIFPDGSSVNLEMQGGDNEGFSGLSDDVDNHYLRLLGAVSLSTVLGVGASFSSGNYNANNQNLQQMFASQAGQNLNRAGQQIVERELSIPPTITVRPGYSCSVIVNKDLVLESFETR